MYDDYLRKHKLTPEQIEGSFKHRTFKIKDADGLIILTNVVLSVNPFAKIIPEKNFLNVELDDEDFIEVREKFRYFLKLWRVEKDLLTMSFFGKHQQFFSPDQYAQSKYREQSKTVNPEYEKAKQKADGITKMAQEKDTAIAISSINEAPKNDVIILNLQRTELLQKILLNSNYKRTNKTIEV